MNINLFNFDRIKKYILVRKSFKVSSIRDGVFGSGDLIETEKQFSDAEIKFMAKKVIDSFPNLDLQHLRDLVANNGFKLGK